MEHLTTDNDELQTTAKRPVRRGGIVKWQQQLLRKFYDDELLFNPEVVYSAADVFFSEISALAKLTPTVIRQWCKRKAKAEGFRNGRAAANAVKASALLATAYDDQVSQFYANPVLENPEVVRIGSPITTEVHTASGSIPSLKMCQTRCSETSFRAASFPLKVQQPIGPTHIATAIHPTLSPSLGYIFNAFPLSFSDPYSQLQHQPFSHAHVPLSRRRASFEVSTQPVQAVRPTRPRQNTEFSTFYESNFPLSILDPTMSSVSHSSEESGTDLPSWEVDSDSSYIPLQLEYQHQVRIAAWSSLPPLSRNESLVDTITAASLDHRTRVEGSFSSQELSTDSSPDRPVTAVSYPVKLSDITRFQKRLQAEFQELPQPDRTSGLGQEEPPEDYGEVFGNPQRRELASAALGEISQRPHCQRLSTEVIKTSKRRGKENLSNALPVRENRRSRKE